MNNKEIAAEAANDVMSAMSRHSKGNLTFRERTSAIILAAIEKVMSGQRIYGEWGTAVVIPDEAAQPQRSDCICDNTNGLHWGKCPLNMQDTRPTPGDFDQIYKPTKFPAGGITNKIIAETPQADFRGRLHPPATEWIPLADGRGKCGVKDKEGWITRGLTEHQALTIGAAHNAALAAEREKTRRWQVREMTANRQLLTAQAAIEKAIGLINTYNITDYEKLSRLSSLVSSVDLSLLHAHDEQEIKPLVDALEDSTCLLRSIKRENWEQCEAQAKDNDDALAKVREDK